MEYLPKYVESTIISGWLQGYTRDEIAYEFGKIKGTVSNIWKKFRNKIGHYEADALMEFVKQLLRQNMTADNCAVGFRIFKILEKFNTRNKKVGGIHLVTLMATF